MCHSVIYSMFTAHVRMVFDTFIPWLLELILLFSAINNVSIMILH